MLHFRTAIALLPLLTVGGLQACADAADTPGQHMPDHDSARKDLPFANGRTFATLDEYLAYRRELGQSDRATWYDEVSPGVYRYVARAIPADQRRTYTREELMAEFGFTQ